MSFSIIGQVPELELLTICINGVFGKILIALAYRPPSTSSVFYFNFLNRILSGFNVNLFSNFLFVGDLNTDVSLSDKFPSTNLCETLELFGLHLVPTSFTRITDVSSSTLDIIATSSSSSIQSCVTIPKLGSSDHQGLFAIINCAPLLHHSSNIPRNVWRYNLANFELANDLLLDIDPASIIINDDVDASWSNFNVVFLDVMSKCIPRSSKRNRPWLSRSLIKLIKRKNLLFSRAKHCPRLLPKFRKIRNQVSNKLRAAKQNFFHNITPTNKRFWKLVKQLNGNKSCIPTLRTGDSVADTDALKANFLSNQFSKNFNSAFPPLTKHDVISPVDDCPSDYLISESEVFTYLANIDCSKASGSDGISGQMLKRTATAITPLITTLFNMSISSGIFPQCWKTSNVSPIPKSGASHNPINYRPISLLPIISKLFERHIHSVLSGHVTISENQWGFLPGRSTTGAILSALHAWERYLENGLETAAVFFDLSKAFDTVPHLKLLEKLRQRNVPQHLIALISSYLYDRKQTVCVNGSCSHMKHVLSGVPQGSVLGPLLFILYIDEVARLPLSEGTIIVYADDLCLYRPISCQHDLFILQKDVDMLTDAINNLALKLNADKCKTITFSRKISPLSFDIYISGTLLNQVSSLKYLGFYLTSDLRWSKHITLMCSTARRKLGYIYRKFYKFSHSSTLLILYKAFVRPILEYGAPVWDPHLNKDLQAIESVQRFATKICLKNWSMPYPDRLKLLDLDSLYTRRKGAKLCLLYKIVHSLSAPSFSLIPVSHNYSTRSHDSCFRLWHAHTNCALHSFYNSSIRAWNELPQEVVSCSTLLTFRKSLYEHNVLPNFTPA